MPSQSAEPAMRDRSPSTTTPAVVNARTVWKTSGYRPAASVLERLREVPVVQRRERSDARTQQRVDDPLVVVEPTRLDCTAAGRLHPRPGDGESVRRDAQLPDERQVVVPPAVGVARN